MKLAIGLVMGVLGLISVAVLGFIVVDHLKAWKNDKKTRLKGLD